MGAISVLVVDDHALFADALQARLLREPDLRPVSVAYTMDAARAQVAGRVPDVAVLDVALDAASGIDLAAHLRQVAPESRVIMLTGSSSAESVLYALRRGARAWLSKTVDTDHLVRVIRGVVHGEAWLAPDLLGLVLSQLLASGAAPPTHALDGLTGREREVLQCMVDGLSRAEIAGELGISLNTVRTHTQNLLAKLDAHSTVEAVAMALRNGLHCSDAPH
jgi:DNA-binding NarL/FixJ family response regulator